VKPTKPPALRSGDKIGIVAPASGFNREGFTAGCDRLRQMGYDPVFSASIFERDLYFAGTADRRLHEFEEMFTREDLAAIICARGGYGSNYLLEKLNFEMIATHPKIFLGCSDVTSLLTAITDRTGLVTFHGPMIAKDIASAPGIELSSWENALHGATSWEIPTAGVEGLQQGRAEGRLYGGCLSLLTASLGTDFEIKTEGTILFLEDVAEKPYRIDRMLMQLRLAGKLDQVGGIIFGEMPDCVQPGRQDYTLQQVVMRVLKDFRGPIVYGLRSGHVSSGNITLPMGVQAELVADGDGVRLRILEEATFSETPKQSEGSL
jgi:muramoyltetrapeptide carboxypeptidase